MPPSERVVRPAITRVPADCLKPVWLRISRRVPVLFQMESNEIELIAGRNGLRQPGFRGDGWRRRGNDLRRRIAKKHLFFRTGTVFQNEFYLRLIAGDRQLHMQRAFRPQLAIPPSNLLAVCLQRDRGIEQRARHEKMDHCLTGLSLESDCCIEICQVRYTDLADRIPELTERLRLARGKEREVRLVVSVDARHQLNIGSIGVGEASVPSVTELVISPGPLFFPGSYVVIRYVHHAGLCRMI